MLRFNYSIISKILLSLLLILVIAGVILFFGRNKLFGGKTKQSAIVNELPDLLTKVKKGWQVGDLERAKDFKDKECLLFGKNKIAEEFLGCNSLYFDCLLKDMARAKFAEFETNSMKFVPQKNGFDNYIEDAGNFVNLNIFEKQTKKLFSLKLQKSCNQKKLPSAVYSAGPQIESSYVWDNFLNDIFIDRHYVTRFDVWSWASRTGRTRLVVEMGGEDNFFEPALSLTPKWQKLYCEDQGKALLESRYFDAATFYPSQNQNIYKYPFPWTKDRDTFLNTDSKITILDCQNVFVKECTDLEIPKNSLRFTSVSWMGIYQSLGGHAEHFRNVFNPEANLKLSHLNLNRNSLWHRTGVRAYWDGVDTNEINFEFVEQYTGRLIESSDKILGVAFRCMDIR